MGLKYTSTELRKRDRAELEKMADEEGLELDEDATVGDYRAALLEIEEPDDEVDDEVDDESDEVDDEEDDELPEVDEIDDAPAKKSKATKKTKYTDGGKDGDGNKLLGAKEAATHIGTDAKTLRQFFRSGKSSFEAVGAGGRYEFSEADLPKIKAEFDNWQANKPGRGRAVGSGTTKKRRGKSQPTAEETIDEIEEVEDLDDLEDIELD